MTSKVLLFFLLADTVVLHWRKHTVTLPHVNLHHRIIEKTEGRTCEDDWSSRVDLYCCRLSFSYVLPKHLELGLEAHYKLMLVEHAWNDMVLTN